MVCLEPLIHDGVGKSGDFEQWRDAAHGFGMTKADISRRPKAIEQVLCCNPARGVVKIDEDVAAKNNVEIPVKRPCPAYR
jgi:hypothetical protein